jgi:hypothetical protein|tara:strand:+ start:9493 stop:11010 length:1518 start_codon:yes stop_codon:yes gene_type:complete
MAVKLFGFEISRPGTESGGKSDIILPSPDDGVQTVSGGAFGTYVDQGYSSRNETDLIKKYREISMHPECEAAIDDIINEAIVSDEDRQVDILLDDVNLSDSIKKKIREEFKLILRMLDFNKRSHELFKRWYVDGRVYFHKVVDSNAVEQGIQKLRIIDPRSIKFVREVIKDEKQEIEKGVSSIKSIKEYFLYSEGQVMGLGMTGSKSAIALTKDSVAYIPSGLTDMNNNIVLGYLHKAIKPVNQLRMMEDALVIYRIARAPERRVFYVDVGNLPKLKAEQYLKDIMNNFKNKLVYDGNTGEVKDDSKFMNMLEDFWMPRRDGGRGTEISTLGGGQNLGEIEDVEYFKKKMFLALNVPQSRMQPESGFQLGRATEINRDELKFTKFVGRLRKKFNEVFQDLLRTQLILKNIITEDDWEKIKEDIHYDYVKDNQFSELKDQEILRERLALVRDADEYIGKYYSVTWIRKNILKQSKEDIEAINSQIEAEVPDEEEEAPDDNDNDGGF